MKKILFLFAIVFALSIYSDSNAQIETNNEVIDNALTASGSGADISNVGLSSIYLLGKYVTSATITGYGSRSLGDFKNTYIEFFCQSDSSRTLLVQTKSKFSTDTLINVNLIDLTAGTSITTAVTGTQTLTTTLRKIYKVVGDYDNLVITGEGRYWLKFRLWSTEYQK